MDQKMNMSEVSGPAPAKVGRRIVLADDEEVALDLLELFIREWSKDAAVLRYQDRDAAWAELQRVDPDLLVTDLRSDNVPGRLGHSGMTGFELLRSLAKKRKGYPVIVASGSLSMDGCEDLARQCAGPDLNVTFLNKPFTRERFLEALRKYLGPADNE